MKKKEGDEEEEESSEEKEKKGRKRLNISMIRARKTTSYELKTCYYWSAVVYTYFSDINVVKEFIVQL